MTYYIRKGNHVLLDYDQTVGASWSVIKNSTSRLVVSAFTTRKDAQDFIDKYVLIGCTTSNNLEYDNSV